MFYNTPCNLLFAVQILKFTALINPLSMKALLITAFQADNPINAINPDRNNDGHLQEFQMRHEEADSYFADPELKKCKWNNHRRDR